MAAHDQSKIGSEAEHLGILERLKDMVYRMSLPDGTYEYVSPGAKAVFGYDRSLLLNTPLFIRTIIHPDYQQYFQEQWEKLLQGIVPPDYEYKILDQDGKERWISQSNTGIYDQDNRIVAIEGLCRDITDFKHAVHKRRESAELLRRSEETYRILFEQSFDGMIIVNEGGKIIWINQAMCDLHGRSREEVLAMENPIEFLFHPEDQDVIIRRRLTLSSGGSLPEGRIYRGLHKDGSVFLLEFRSKAIQWEGRPATQAIARDITDRIKAEKALKESEEKYRALFENIADAVFIVDPETRHFLDCNQTALKRLGYSKEEMLRMTPLQLHPQEEKDIIIESKDGRPHDLPLRFNHLTKDGQKIPVEVITSSTTYHGRKAWVSIARDISDRVAAESKQRDLEAQLQQAQKMEAIGALAGGIAHDFNNLLQGIIGYSQIILLRMKQDNPHLTGIRQIETIAQKAAELTQQLLTFSRKVESVLRPFDLNQSVIHVERLLKRTIPKMIKIEITLEENLKAVNADPTQIEQMLMNLALNAKDAMPDGGNLTIETKNTYLDKDYCRMHVGAKPGECVRLSVSDTGLGMDDGALEHIFEPFYTTKAVGKGTGLGLAMVYGIVMSHGGHITCLSRPKQGTMFEIYLPAIEKIEDEETIEAELDMPSGGEETILLVDDEEILRDLGEEILTSFGYKIITAPDGERALDIFRRQQKDISIIILDLIMPGIGGRRCLEELLEIDPQARVVIASGYDIDDKARSTIEEKSRGTISKPYDIKQMLKVIREVLDAS